MARFRVGPGARLRGATPAGGVGRHGVRGSRAERGTRVGRPAGAAARRAGRGRSARPAGQRHPRSARRARPRPHRRRDARQSAGPAGASARYDRGGAGGRLRTARRDGSAGPDPGPLPAAGRRLARTDPATDAAGGGRPGRRRDTALAGRADTRDRPRRPRTWPFARSCWRSAAGCGSAIRWSDRRSTAQRRRPSDRSCTAPWRQPPTPRTIPIDGHGIGRTRRAPRTRRWPAS